MAVKKDKPMKLQGRGYQEYYVKAEDVPKNMGNNTAIIYQTPTRIYGYEDMFDLSTFSLKGLNYQNVQKEILTHNLVFCWKQIENMKREIASDKIKIEILTKKLVDHNISAKLDPEEIENYEVMLSDILSNEIRKITESENIPLKEEIIARVRAEIAKADYESTSSYEYNIVRINNALKYNDMLLDDVLNGKNRDLSTKDRATLVLNIQKANRDNIDKLKEICKETGRNIRDVQNPQMETQEDTPQQNSTPKGFDLSSLMKRDN
ncbi:MAG: hypothetical protein ACRC7S_10620 [Cetobacterium sp.]